MTEPLDPDALAEHLEGVRRLARTLVRDDHEADDVVQDTMVAALESRIHVRSGLRAWLSGIARNMARRKARSAGRRAKYEGAASGAGAAPATADVIVRAAEQSRVLDLLVRMEEPYRSAVLLRFVEGLPPREIAKRMGLPVETVRTHVKRGVQRLREQLAAAHGGHAGERRAALALAAKEPLGAAHARAVALARASGLAVLLIVGAALLWGFSRDSAEEADPASSYLADAENPVVPDGTGADPRAPAAPLPIDTAPKPDATPAEPAQGEPANAAPGGMRPDRPDATPVKPPGGALLPGRPPEEEDPLPEAPRKAVENKEPAAGSGKKPPEKPAGNAADEGGDFYEGETTFSGKQVDVAIQKGVAWLKKRQGRDGSWGAIKFNATYAGGQGASEGMPAGPTALALYALLKCKGSVKDPAIVKGFRYLEKHHRLPASSYETSMLLLAVTATADPYKLTSSAKKRRTKPKLTGRYRGWAVKLVDHLVDKREARGWRYNIRRGKTPVGGNEDLSSTQLAALALFSAHRLGIRVKLRVWEDILAFTLAQQADEGARVTYRDPIDPKRERVARARGFAYIKGAQDADESKPRGGMTACGLANLEMARFVLSGGGERRAKWDARDDAARVQEAIFDGLAWLDANWSPFEDPRAERKNVYHVYWLYALERAMDLLDLRLVGRHAWYSEMGQQLLNRQNREGHWDVRRARGGHDVLDTGFALLFLKRATKGAIPFGSVTGGRNAPVDNR